MKQEENYSAVFSLRSKHEGRVTVLVPTIMKNHRIMYIKFYSYFAGLTAAAAAAAAATNAAIAEAMKVKKIKLEAMSNYHANNNQHGADSENGDLNSSVGKSQTHRYTKSITL